MVTQSPALSRTQGATEPGLGRAAFRENMCGCRRRLRSARARSLDFDSFRTPDLSIVAPRATATLRETPLRPVTGEDLVDTEGRCAGVPVGPDPNIPATSSRPTCR